MCFELTAAVIGSGYMGEKYLEILSKLVNRLILCSNDVTKAKMLAEKYGCAFYSDYQELYKKEKPHFVCICLPTHLHLDATVKALNSGIHVLCEKPFASSLKEAEQMVAAAEKNSRTLMIGHLVRFSKPYEYLKRCIKDNRFGKLLYLEMYRHSDTPLWSVGNWLQNTERSGGVVRDLHVHDTDAIVGLLGHPKAVRTVGCATTCRTIYNFGNGTAVSASGSWRNAKGFPFYEGFDAVFENASIQKIGDQITLYQNDSAINPLEKEEFSEFFQGESLNNELLYFCHCIENNLKPKLCSPEETLITMAVNDAEIESLNHKEEVEIC